jgi:hypothetical protein
MAVVMAALLLQSAVIPVPALAQALGSLPVPGAMVGVSQAFVPAVLKGVKVDLSNPFAFDFIVDKGQSALEGEALSDEGRRLIKYFLTAITVPEKETWVNLSPYEQNRIIPDALGITEMGRDMIAQDYLLKQLTASMIHPDTDLGREFWAKVYAEARAKLGTSEIPLDTFNKVWIMPDKIALYETASGVYIVQHTLKVLTQQDYLATANNKLANVEGDEAVDKAVNDLSARVMREVVLPAITKEVNEGRNFAPLRQIYDSLLLAAWYKSKVKDSILNMTFADKNKVAGNVLADRNEKDRIYEQYVAAFKKGVYNYIREDVDEVSQEVIPRKYFSGGLVDDSQERIRSGKYERVAASGAGVTTGPSGNVVDIRADIGPEKAQTDAAEKVEKKDRILPLIVRWKGDARYEKSFVSSSARLPGKNLFQLKDQENPGKFDAYVDGDNVYIAESFLEEVERLGNPYGMLQATLDLVIDKRREVEKYRSAYKKLIQRLPATESRDVFNVKGNKKSVEQMVTHVINRLLINEEAVEDQVKNAFTFTPQSSDVHARYEEIKETVEISLYKIAISRLLGRTSAENAKFLRLSEDAPVKNLDNKRLRVGIIPFTADPPTIAHILANTIMASAEARLGTVIIDTTGADYRKEGLVQTADNRLFLSQQIEEILGDIVTPLPGYLKNNTGLNGEERLPNYMELNTHLAIDWFYIYGDDHGLMTQLLTGRWNRHSENTKYYIDNPGFRVMIQKLLGDPEIAKATRSVKVSMSESQAAALRGYLKASDIDEALEFHASEFGDSFEKVQSLIAELAKAAGLSAPVIVSLEEGIDRLNNSKEPFTMYFKAVSSGTLSGEPLKAINGFMRTLSNESSQLIKEQKWDELKVLPEGMRFKRVILEAFYPSKTPKSLSFPVVDEEGNVEWRFGKEGAEAAGGVKGIRHLLSSGVVLVPYISSKRRNALEKTYIAEGGVQGVEFPELDVDGKTQLLARPANQTITGLMAIRGDFESKGFDKALDRKFIVDPPVMMETPLATRGISATSIRNALPKILRGLVTDDVYENLSLEMLKALIFTKQGREYIPIALAKSIDKQRTEENPPEDVLSLPKTIQALLTERLAGVRHETDMSEWKMFVAEMHKAGFDVDSEAGEHSTVLTIRNQNNGVQVGKVEYRVRVDLKRLVSKDSEGKETASVGVDQTLLTQSAFDTKFPMVSKTLGYIEMINGLGVTDSAMAAEKFKRLAQEQQDIKGGIDFDTANADLNIQSSGPGIQFKIDPAMLQRGEFDGLVPVIRSVTPVNDIPAFFGMAA